MVINSASGLRQFYLHLKDEPLFAFAGLYDIWHDISGESHHFYHNRDPSNISNIKHIYYNIKVYIH